MRAARLIRMMLSLQTRGRVTAGTFARELEVSPRTILRDVDALSEAGAPIVTQRGPAGGIELLDGFETRLTGLTDDEIEALALVLNLGAIPAGALGSGDALQSLRLKLHAALPEQRRRLAQAAGQRIRTSAAPPAPNDRLVHLRQAIRGRRIVHARFTGSREESALWPLALVMDRKGWSLEAVQDGARTVIPVPALVRLRIDAAQFRWDEDLEAGGIL